VVSSVVTTINQNDLDQVTQAAKNLAVENEHKPLPRPRTGVARARTQNNQAEFGPCKMKIVHFGPTKDLSSNRSGRLIPHIIHTP
jgi:hypothetical protein